MDDAAAKPMAERVEFTLTATQGESTFYASTKGRDVRWREEHGGMVVDTGWMPRELFLLAAKVLVEACEDEPDVNMTDLAEAAWRNNVTVTAIAMAWPAAEGDELAEHVRRRTCFGFDLHASAAKLDTPPGIELKFKDADDTIKPQETP